MYEEFLIDMYYDQDPLYQVIPIALQEELLGLNESDYNKRIEKIHLEIMDVEKFIKANNCKEITNPVTFSNGVIPTSDGLLSNEIFGITKTDRAGIFGYIDLGGLFMDPSCYKAWSRMDSRIKSIVHETQKYIINEDGDFEVNPHGKSGVKFLKDNFDKINFKRTASNKRDLKIDYLKKNKDRMFISKYLVIPAYYRDINNTGRNIGIGAINKMYASLLLAVRSLKSTQDYGFSDTGAICGRIQETLVLIYDWFCGNSNAAIKEEGAGIGRKMGIMRRANMAKTTDYSSRLVLSAPNCRVETVNDLMVKMDRAALPLAAICADFYPYMLFNIKRFFENELGAIRPYRCINKNGKVLYKQLKDPLIEFSDERIKKELKRFIHGYSNRFIPIELPVEDAKPNETVYMQFKGRPSDDADNDQVDSIYNRRLTWVDVFYRAAVESTKNKSVFITRFPIDSYLNQFPINIVVSSTKDTEPIYIDGEYYQYYPKIREEMIEKDTSRMFVDTLMLSNLYLDGIGGDYDGDTATAKSLYLEEANVEAQEFIHSKFNYVNLGAENVRVVKKDALQSLYNLTKILPDTKLVDPVF